MAEVEITRKQIITVEEVGQNSYGDLTFTDKEGKSYKVGAKRVQYVEKDVIPGTAVQLNFAIYKGREYVYNTTSVKEGLDQVPKPPLQAPQSKSSPPKEQSDSSSQKMSKEDWAEREGLTRKSIERQTSLNAAVEVAKSFGANSVDKVLTIAKRFEAYLEGINVKEVQLASRLVEEAKKLGAEEEEEMPF